MIFQKTLANPLQLLVYGDTPLGRSSTPQTVSAITLNDVKEYYKRIYVPNDAFLLFSGDVTVEKARALAEKLLAGWQRADELVKVDYALPPAAEKRRIILIDNPDAKQSVIRMALRAYDVRSEDKFPGSLAGNLLSSGIDSRLGRYIRAEKGYAYGVRGYFMPDRHAGIFSGSTETAFETTTPTIEAMFKVFNDLKTTPAPADELEEARNRAVGSLLMQMQTIGQQATRRVDIILNDYPLDYYDKYPQRIAQVTPEQVSAVMKQYVDEGRMAIVVVAPAEKVREQLDKLGDVQVLPMPLKRPGMAPPHPGGDELIRPRSPAANQPPR
jgi:predicted Zn-dependent peptidase